MQSVQVNLSFMCPCTIQIVGPTMSGKSSLTRKLLTHARTMFHPAPTRIVYVYGVFQDEFKTFDPTVQLVHGIEPLLREENFFDKSQPTLLVLDDVMDEIAQHKNATALFTRDVHHKNVTVLFLSQNLFKQGKNMRDITLNSQYLILFKSVRDVQQIKVLSQQLGMPHLEPAYQKAIKEPYGYLVVNLRPETPEIIRLQSHLFDYRRVYVQE